MSEPLSTLSDPFFTGHPTLNHGRIKVRAYLFPEPLDNGDEGPYEERRICWLQLTLDERLELERLLAKAARR